ncbi:hypothetical protein Tco_0337778, partial [Tanacetum coccineum]
MTSDAKSKSRLRKANAPLVRFSGKTYHPLGLIDLRVTMGEPRKSKTVLLEFAVVKCRSPYNVFMGRTEMRSFGTVGSTIHSMIKFLTAKGVATMKTSKEALYECRQIERMQSSWKEAQWYQHKEKMSKIREQAILRARSIPNQRAGKELMITKETWEEDTVREKVIIHNDRLDQHVDYTSLNKVCAKDMYPLPEIEGELGSLMGYQYKCFLRLPREHNQV